MEPLTLFERIVLAVGDYWRRVCCPNHRLETSFTAEIFTKRGWERCSGVAICCNCRSTFFVSVPADDSERQLEKNSAAVGVA